MVGRVGEMLRLQAEPVALFVDATRLARQRAVEEVARIELHARFCRKDFQYPATRGLLHPSRKMQPRVQGASRWKVIA